MADDIIVRLKRKRKIIEQFQKDVAKQEGQREQLFNQLKTESGADSLEQADTVVEELHKELDGHETILEKLDTKMAKIIHDAVPRNAVGTD